MFKKVVKTLNATVRFNLFKQRRLLKVGHRINHKCNYKCSYCSLWNDDVKVLNTERVLKLVDEVADMGCVAYAISGGEPLLRKDLPKILERIKKRGMITKIVTNGSLVAKRIDDICGNIDVLNFSFDTMNPDVPEEEGFIKVLDDRVLEGIKAAVEKVPHVGLNMVITKRSATELEDIVKYSVKLGIKSFTFLPLITHFNYKTPKEFAESYDEIYGGMENYKKAILKLRELRNKGFPITMSNMMLDAMYTFDIPKMKCISGYMSCGISPDGKIGTCYEFFKETSGSLSDKSFRELWEELGKNLDIVDSCQGCLFHCYFEPNAIFSGNTRATLSYGKRYFKAFFRQ